MRKFQLIPLILMVLALPALMAAQELTIYETSLYSISYPSAWDDTANVADTGDFFSLTNPSLGIIPLSVMVGIDDLNEDDQKLSLKAFAERATDANNAEFVNAGMSDMIEVVASSSVSINGLDAYRIKISVDAGDLVMSMDNYYLRHQDQMFTIAFMGDDLSLAENKEVLTAIKDSFRFK